MSIVEDGGEMTFKELRARVLKERAENESKLSPIDKLRRAATSLFSGPQHVEEIAFGASAEECLRRLEKRAGLPEGDLRFNGQNYKCGNLLSSGTRHLADSETGGKWKADGKPGYVSASVFEVTEGDVPVAKFMGQVHVSRNCPGVAAEGKCAYCEYVFRN